ncbi:hypothetical protein ACFL96_11195 [Thermoproteota archaeon]
MALRKFHDNLEQSLERLSKYAHKSPDKEFAESLDEFEETFDKLSVIVNHEKMIEFVEAQQKKYSIHSDDPIGPLAKSVEATKIDIEELSKYIPQLKAGNYQYLKDFLKILQGLVDNLKGITQNESYDFMIELQKEMEDLKEIVKELDELE